MASRLGFLETRVARRMLAHFLTASLLPALLISLVGVWVLRQTLERDATDRAARSAKSASLLFHGALAAQSVDFAALVAASADGTDGAERRVTLELHHTEGDPDQAAEFVLRTDGRALARRQLDPARLWLPVEELLRGEDARFCVFVVESWERVHCDSEVTDAHVARLRNLAIAGASAEVGERSRTHVDARTDLFLREAYGAPSWRLVIEESRDAAAAENRSITVTLILLLSLAVVTAFTFAHRQIRVSTEPLRLLMDATRRIARGDLETPVRISSQDEYMALGESFNLMSNALSAQLRLLRSLDALNAVALGERNAHAIVGRAAQSLATESAWSSVSVGHIPVRRPDRLLLSTSTSRSPTLVSTTEVFEATEQLASGVPRRSGTRVELSLLHGEELVGVLRLESAVAVPDDAPEIAHAHRIADRVALALGNVRLLEQLEALSAGSLRAFARAIDANSPWTAGHSERVTHRAIAIGRQLGLGDADLGRLYRGGLLHDIGKVGVPPSVLDKVSGLDAAERAAIERHPVVGERILSPIPGFTDILPIVRSHHERHDGQGYPDRLAGKDIPWLAAVLAVADVYDAVTSDRPYRPGLPVDEAVALIVAGSGSQFDPRVVEAFRELDHAAMHYDVARDLVTEAAALGYPARGGSSGWSD